MARFVLYGTLMLLGIIGWLLITSASEVRFGAQAIPQQPTLGLVAYGYIVTLLGVFLGTAYRELQRMRELGQVSIGEVGAFLKSIFTSIDFWMSLCGSPLVYALLLKATDGGSFPGLTAIALENGFCCTIIISNIVAKDRPPG